MLQLNGGVFSSTLVDRKSGFISVEFTGEGAHSLFANESGGHRWQRISPTEKRGRIHTSTVTVAVLNPYDPEICQLTAQDVEIKTTTGTGPGGQHRNKTESCVVATHKETGISVRVDMKSQYQSKAMALKILSSRVTEMQQTQAITERSQDRKKQVGSGMRGDKIRTYRVQDDRIKDHRTGKKGRLKKWLRGEW